MTEMSKTPEEIKKGLECAVDKKCIMQECPYYSEEYNCIRAAQVDALALIQQLEAQNAELFKKIEQLERERDAAVADLATTHKCEPCKHRTSNSYISNECFDCVNFCNFEWRGPREEKTENP